MDKNKDIAYPPGGFLMWLIISIELLTVFLFLVFFIIDQKNNVTMFNNSVAKNNINIALLNTIILMLSGYLITKVNMLNEKINIKMILGSFLLGLIFVLIKLFEYKIKIDQDLLFGANTFFTYYWCLTLFHLLHVLIALSLFVYVIFIYKKKSIVSVETIKSIEVFWHLCDLIWIIILPFLYSLKQGDGIYSIYITLFLFVVKSFIIFSCFIKIGASHIFWQITSWLFITIFFILVFISQKIYL